MADIEVSPRRAHGTKRTSRNNIYLPRRPAHPTLPDDADYLLGRHDDRFALFYLLVYLCNRFCHILKMIMLKAPLVNPKSLKSPEPHRV